LGGAGGKDQDVLQAGSARANQRAAVGRRVSAVCASARALKNFWRSPPAAAARRSSAAYISRRAQIFDSRTLLHTIFSSSLHPPS
jgi:hypothetical protein